jgi:hypothetical protein
METKVHHRNMEAVDSVVEELQQDGSWENFGCTAGIQ